MRKTRSQKQIAMMEIIQQQAEKPSSAPERVTSALDSEIVQTSEVIENIEESNHQDVKPHKIEIISFGDDSEAEESIPNQQPIRLPIYLREIPDELHECAFCAEQMPKEHMDKTFSCEHVYCRVCLDQYFKTRISEFKVIQCPQEDCLAELALDIGVEVLGETYAEKYQEIKFRAFVDANREIYRICPEENCHQGMLEVNKKKNTGTCQKCEGVFCLECMMKAHRGKCEGLGANLLTNKYRFKRCVKCRMVVERNQGCPHMTCKCGAQFCYNCGSTWNSSHYCLRSRIGGPLITEKLQEKLKCLRSQEYQYQSSFLSFLCRLPYHMIRFVLLFLWFCWCTIYGVVMFGILLVGSLLLGQIVLMAQLCKSHRKLAKFAFVLCLIFFPVMMPFSGLALWLVIIYESGGKHFLYPAFGGSLFPIFKLCF